MSTGIPSTTRRVRGPAGDIALRVYGETDAPVVLFAHSILTSSAMWEAQAVLLAAHGYHVVCADTRGHGASTSGEPPWCMDDLAADSVAVLDGLGIASAHYVGLSLGGMSGFGLGIHHADRLLSLCLCDCRADTPPAAAAPWDERIAVAERDGCVALADPTIERWFGGGFLAHHPDIAHRFRALITGTSVAGLVGCARAIQTMDYLGSVARITTPTGLIVGANDGVLPDAMRTLAGLVPGATLDIIADAGHLPNIDQPAAFNAALLRHLARVASIPPH